MATTETGRRSEGLVWIVAVVVLLIAAAVFAVHTRNLHPLSRPHLPWWALALGFAACERAVVHLHFRRSAHSFTLADIPMVLGLIFAGGPALLIGALLGSIVPWLMDRHLPPLKIVFNLAQLALATCVALTITHALTGSVHTISPALWLIVLLSVEAGALVSVALISLAITLSEGQLTKGMLRQMFGMDLVLTVTNTALALAAATIILKQSEAVPLMLIPAGLAYLAYRAYLDEHQRRERLEFLYEATRTLTRASDVVAGLDDLLVRAQDAFRVERAELLLFSSDASMPLRLSAPKADDTNAYTPVDPGLVSALADLLNPDSPAIILERPNRSAALERYLQELDVRVAMVAPLPGDREAIGAIVLADRVGVARTFDQADVTLLGAFATNMSVALQFDRVEQAVWRLHELQERLEQHASHDPLTGLANRARFTAQLRAALDRQGGAVTVLVVDLDDFSQVNDTLGLEAGDEVLTSVAERLRGCVLNGDLVARLDGDEFGVLLRDTDDPEKAGIAVAVRLGKAVAGSDAAARRHVALKASIGIAAGRAGYDRADEVLGAADIAMHQAKRTGRGGHAVYEPGMQGAALERHSLRSDLERALDKAQLVVEFQPMVSLTDGRVIAAEALVRWQRSYGRVLAASDFLSLAIEAGLMPAIGDVVLAEACRQGRDWLGAGSGGDSLRVHINLSAVELADDRLPDRITQQLERTGLPPELLVLEVTEGSILSDLDAVALRLKRLRECGVRLAVDDFGAGTARLGYLRSLPLDLVKISRGFVDRAPGNPPDAAFLRTTKELCDALELQIVGTGIETDEQLALLRSFGYELGQGFLLGRPGTARSTLVGGYRAQTEPAGWLKRLSDITP